MARSKDVLLKVEGLKTYFYTEEGVVRAVDGVDLEIKRGEILGLVGESGCGKSVTALSIMRLVQSPPGRIVSGRILLDGEDLLKKSEKEMWKIRGTKISMIFQDPHTSLDPAFTIGFQIAEPIELHQVLERKLLKKEDVPKKVEEMLSLVKIPDPGHRVNEYPHQLSGGVKRRVMIALVLSGQRAVLRADEPTTALDVTIQAQILDLLRELRHKLKMSVLMITHNLGVVAELCDRVAVMYAGHIGLEGVIMAVVSRPRHPYTRALLQPGPSFIGKRKRLRTIPGFVPSLLSPPPGCKFHPRCSEAMPICKKVFPQMVRVAKNHFVRCHLYARRRGK